MEYVNGINTTYIFVKRVYGKSLCVMFKEKISCQKILQVRIGETVSEQSKTMTAIL